MNRSAVELQTEAGGLPATIPQDIPAGLLQPLITPQQYLQLHRVIVEIANQLDEGTDYGIIPGTDKPTMLKPGAEKFCFAFGCFPRYEIVEREIDHDRRVEWVKRRIWWKAGEKQVEETVGSSVGLYRYVIRCTLHRRTDNAVVAEGIGSCCSMESKYVDRPRDLENTVLKMAEKRALIAAALNGFGLSDRFTQDAEDFAGGLNEAPVERMPPEAMAMPFGASKGTPLGKLETKDLEGAVRWAKDKGKFQDFVRKAEQVLEARRKPPSSNGDAGTQTVPELLAGVDPVFHDVASTKEQLQELLRAKLELAAPDDLVTQAGLLEKLGTFEFKDDSGKKQRKVPERLAKMGIRWLKSTLAALDAHLEQARKNSQPFPESAAEAAAQGGIQFAGEGGYAPDSDEERAILAREKAEAAASR